LGFWFAVFFRVGNWRFMQGVFEKTACRTWFFDGKNVVICGHNVVLMRTFFVGEKLPTF
jgi:hypothetical protein